MSYLNSDGRQYSLFLTNRAKADLDDIYVYGLQKWDEIQADSYLELLDDALTNLSKNPFMGKQARQLPEGYKSFRVGRHLIIYRVEETTIYVLRVIGDRMDIAKQILQPE